MLFFFAQYSFC